MSPAPGLGAAAAGYGKTLSPLAAQFGRSVAWLALDEAEADPGPFLRLRVLLCCWR